MLFRANSLLEPRRITIVDIDVDFGGTTDDVSTGRFIRRPEPTDIDDDEAAIVADDDDAVVAWVRFEFVDVFAFGDVDVVDGDVDDEVMWGKAIAIDTIPPRKQSANARRTTGNASIARWIILLLLLFVVDVDVVAIDAPNEFDIANNLLIVYELKKREN